MSKFAAIEASRLARDSRDLTARVSDSAEPVKATRTFLRTDFAAGKVFDDDRFEPTHANLTRDMAETVAGRLRDGASDETVKRMLDEGWTYGYRMLRGNLSPSTKRVAYVPRKVPGKLALMGSAQRHDSVGRRISIGSGGGPGRGAAGWSAEKRREVSRKANTARWSK